MKIDRLSGRFIESAGKKYWYCSGTDYLGMAYNKKLQRSIIEAYSQFGLNYGSSRNHQLFEDLYTKVEQHFSDWLGLPASLTVSSGTLAGQLVRNNVKAMSYAIIEAPRLHPSLKDIYNDAIEQNINSQHHDLINEINCHTSEKIAVLAVDIDPLSIEEVDLSFLAGVKNKEILLILDDTHGLGIVGKKGAGYISKNPILKEHNVILVSSLAKGISLPGGLISGPKFIIDKIRNTGHFAGSSPISPAYLHGFLESLDQYQIQLEKLRTNINLFKVLLSDEVPIKSLPEFPIFLLENEVIGKILKKHKVWISSSRYPYPHSTLLNRLILNGAHTENDIQKIAHYVNLSYNLIS